ncbi:MAG: transketolase [Planctomycetes bacterium]|nr:transketolase [Planctomycetota bacterium]
MTESNGARADALENERLDTVRLFIDQFIDIMLNHRQSGHPGGSRSKAHMIAALMAGGAMRWDVRDPTKPLADRFVLVAGHTIPVVYAALAVVNQAMALRFEWTGDERFRVLGGEHRTLMPIDLLTLRRRGGLQGHAEFEGKSLFVKFNTGPSGHGAPAAVGQALALKAAGHDDVQVFAVEGEGGHSAGAHHESKNSAYGLGLSNLVYLIDWNDNGIDPNVHSSVVHGTPRDWFEPYGFRVVGTERGSDMTEVARTLRDTAFGDNPARAPRCAWFKTEKGRGYVVTGYKSHGAAHKRNHENFWKCREEFIAKYGVSFEGQGQGDPGPEHASAQSLSHIQTVVRAMAEDRAFVEWLTDRLVEIGDRVPTATAQERVDPKVDLLRDDPSFTDVSSLPAALFAEPGANLPNRAGFEKFGAWWNSYALEKYGRPIVIAMAADLAESTNIAGFMKPFEGHGGTGWYQRDENPTGALLPQQITEFTNAGICAGLGTVNFAEDGEHKFAGFIGACATYGSFSYLKYGMMRLFSQLAQDCDLKTGRILWVAGHSGPETAEDARTHFGILSPGVTQLFPDGHVINLHPWEHNEVAPALAAAFATDVPIIALHLTRPPVQIPDRKALGMASHLDAAKGAYVLRAFDDRPHEGVVLCQGTSVVANIVGMLPWFASDGPNVKIVCCVSSELFARQSQEYRDAVLPEDEWLDSMICANQGRRVVRDWILDRRLEEYAMTPDFDNRWRTGGSVDDVVEESHLDPAHLKEGILRFVRRGSQSS